MAASMPAALPGILFRYSSKPANVAFLCGHHHRHCVLVGGLGDSVLFANYATLLAANLDSIGWSLVQPLLTTSLIGWGVGSLDQDADELAQLSEHLRSCYDSEVLVLAGHSTGCQDAVRYCNQQRRGTAAPLGVILQAPVSDRDWLATQPDTAARAQLCEQMAKDGRQEDIAFRDEDGTPITARRFLSLAKPLGDDDLFSVEFGEQQLKERLGHLTTVPVLAMFGGADEFVPPSTDAHQLCGNFAAALEHEKSRALVIEDAGHSLTGHENEAVDVMVQFIESLT